ncbi:MAG TPA: hypothetical protein VGI96_41985 [Streptosporangiaceae bacterium]|jgi:hypothetical protein
MTAIASLVAVGVRRRRQLRRRYAAAVPVILRAALAGDPSRQTLRRDQ